jgi:mRNA-degrading endonuclease RelE of RelBE toxin-antitoxin system
VYKVAYSPRAAKSIKRIPKYYQINIKDKVEKLSKNPYIPGTIKLVDYPAAQFRYRVGNYRILFDINNEEKVIEILDIKKREEKTYK